MIATTAKLRYHFIALWLILVTLLILASFHIGHAQAPDTPTPGPTETPNPRARYVGPPIYGPTPNPPEPVLQVTQWDCGIQTYVLLFGPETLPSTDGWINYYWQYRYWSEPLIYAGYLPSQQYGHVHVWVTTLAENRQGQSWLAILKAGPYQQDIGQPRSYTCAEPTPTPPGDKVIYLPMVTQ